MLNKYGNVLTNIIIHTKSVRCVTHAYKSIFVLQYLYACVCMWSEDSLEIHHKLPTKI